MDLVALRVAVELEIENFAHSTQPDAFGDPMPREWVDAQLTEMRAALVTPIWRDIRVQDAYDQVYGASDHEIRRCVLVADDGDGYELYFDPSQAGYLLAYSGSPPVTSGVRGDAVGCFMAR